MEPQIRSSFIPKKPLPVQSGEPQKRKKRFDMLSFVGTTLFLVSVLGSGYVYFLERQTINQIDNLGAELDTIHSGIDFSRVEEFEKFDKKIDTVTQLTRQHNVLSSILVAIGERTLHDVGFSMFKFLDTAEGRQGPVIGLEGAARTYNAFVVQSDEFRRADFITDFYFEEVGVGGEGIGAVAFKAVLNIDREKLLFTAPAEEESVELIEEQESDE